MGHYWGLAVQAALLHSTKFRDWQATCTHGRLDSFGFLVPNTEVDRNRTRPERRFCRHMRYLWAVTLAARCACHAHAMPCSSCRAGDPRD